MKINNKKLIFHDYSNDDVVKICKPFFIKDERDCCEIKEENFFPQKAIKESAIVVSYRDSDRSEDYAFLYFDIERRGDERMYIITQVILDDKLDIKSIMAFIRYTLESLYCDNILSKEYIKTNKQYQFYYLHKEEAIENVCNDIISLK